MRSTVWNCEWFSVEAISKDSKTGAIEDPYFGIVAPDSVGILPITDDGRFVFVRQYRPTLERETIELPAGMVGPDESPYEAAERELKEETGMGASRWLALGSCTLMPSRFSNRLSWYVGLDVSADAASTSPELEPLLLTPAELIRRENDLGADQLLALGIIALAHAKFPRIVPAVW